MTQAEFSNFIKGWLYGILLGASVATLIALLSAEPTNKQQPLRDRVTVLEAKDHLRTDDQDKIVDRHSVDIVELQDLVYDTRERVRALEAKERH